MMDIVEDLRLNHVYCPKEVILEAADRIETLEFELKCAKMAINDLLINHKPDREALDIVLVAAESFITIIEDYPQEADAMAKYKAAIAKLRGIEG